MYTIYTNNITSNNKYESIISNSHSISIINSTVKIVHRFSHSHFILKKSFVVVVVSLVLLIILAFTFHCIVRSVMSESFFLVKNVVMSESFFLVKNVGELIVICFR